MKRILTTVSLLDRRRLTHPAAVEGSVKTERSVAEDTTNKRTVLLFGSSVGGEGGKSVPAPLSGQRKGESADNL